MPLKNPVAAERRVDLASLLCLISRHGPAVALALIAMVSVVAGIIMYRSVRGKRRKATARAADGDAYGGGAEAEGGRSPGEGTTTGSTDGSDDDPSDVLKVDPDLIQTHLNVRRRRRQIAVDAKPPQSDEEPDNAHAVSDHEPEMALAWDAAIATGTDERERSEDAVGHRRTDTDQSEEGHGNEEAEPDDERTREDKEEVLEAGCSEEDYVTDDADSPVKAGHGEEALQFVGNGQVCFKQPPHVTDDGDNDRRGDDSNKAQTNHLESDIEEAVGHGTEEENHLACNDSSRHTSDDHLFLEKENEGQEAVEECVDHLQTESSTCEDASVDANQRGRDTALPVSLSGTVADAEAEISNVTNFPDLSLNDEKPQSEQREDVTPPTPEKYPDNDGDVGPLMSTHDTKGEPDKDVDQQVQVMNGDISEADFHPVPDTNSCVGEDILMAEEICHLHEGVEVEEERKAHQQTETQSSTSEQEKPSRHEQCDPDAVHDALDVGQDVLCPPSPPETEIQHEAAENGTSVDQQMVLNDDANEEIITIVDDAAACPHENNLIAKEMSNPLEHVDDSLDNETSTEDADRCHLNNEQQMDKNDSHNKNNDIPSTAVHHVAKESESVLLVPTPLCLREPTDIKGNGVCLPSISTDAKPEIPGVAEFSDTASNGQNSQPEQKEEEKSSNLDKDTDPDTLCPPTASENQLTKEENGTLLDQEDIEMMHNDALESSGPTSNDVVAYDGESKAMGEELSHHGVPLCNEEPSHTEDFDRVCPNSVDIASLTVENLSYPLLISVCEDQQSDHMVNNETSGADVVAYNSMAPTMSVSTLCQDQQHTNTENDIEQCETTTSTSHDLPIFQNNMLSFNQTEPKDSDIEILPSPGVGVESGISSMAVSPDLQETSPNISIMVESMTLPVAECDFQVIPCHELEEQIEASNSFYADDVAVSAQSRDAIEPHSSGISPQSQHDHAEWATYELLANNEDVFGFEVEDSYHKALDQLMVQFTDNVASLTDELKRQTENDIVIEVERVKEKKDEACSVKGKEIKAEDEKDEDYEKTEISIMEATMDNNEWITESNYQVLPWMNISVPSFVQDLAKPEQKPPEAGAAVTDATCMDTSDIPPVVEHTAAEENAESAKKVVAVQPMPQNVNVTFRVHYLSQSPYQTVAVTGDQQELGSWKGFIPLERAKDGYWSCVVSLPAESHVEWKFVVLDKGEVCRWEECGNRLLDTGFGDDLLVQKWWGFL